MSPYHLYFLKAKCFWIVRNSYLDMEVAPVFGLYVPTLWDAAGWAPDQLVLARIYLDREDPGSDPGRPENRLSSASGNGPHESSGWSWTCQECVRISQELCLHCVCSQILRLQMTHLYYERGSRDCAPLKYLIELFSACLSSYPSLGSSSILPAAAHWQTTSCLHLRLRTPWRTTWHDGVCVKCYKSGRLPGTCGELTRLQPWRLWLPSADKALLIQMNSAASKGDLSMCQLPTSHPQISSTGQAGGICRKSSGLVKQHMEDPQ